MSFRPSFCLGSRHLPSVTVVLQLLLLLLSLASCHGGLAAAAVRVPVVLERPESDIADVQYLPSQQEPEEKQREAKHGQPRASRGRPSKQQQGHPIVQDQQQKQQRGQQQEEQLQQEPHQKQEKQRPGWQQAPVQKRQWQRERQQDEMEEEEKQQGWQEQQDTKTDHRLDTTSFSEQSMSDHDAWTLHPNALAQLLQEQPANDNQVPDAAVAALAEQGQQEGHLATGSAYQAGPQDDPDPDALMRQRVQALAAQLSALSSALVANPSALKSADSLGALSSALTSALSTSDGTSSVAASGSRASSDPAALQSNRDTVHTPASEEAGDLTPMLEPGAGAKAGTGAGRKGQLGGRSKVSPEAVDSLQSERRARGKGEHKAWHSAGAAERGAGEGRGKAQAAGKARAAKLVSRPKGQVQAAEQVHNNPASQLVQAVAQVGQAQVPEGEQASVPASQRGVHTSLAPDSDDVLRERIQAMSKNAFGLGQLA